MKSGENQPNQKLSKVQGAGMFAEQSVFFFALCIALAAAEEGTKDSALWLRALALVLPLVAAAIIDIPVMLTYAHTRRTLTTHAVNGARHCFFGKTEGAEASESTPLSNPAADSKQSVSQKRERTGSTMFAAGGASAVGAANYAAHEEDVAVERMEQGSKSPSLRSSSGSDSN